VSSTLSRRPLGLKVGYASSRTHNNNTSRSGFHNSHGVFKRFAQAVRIQGGQREFARTPTTTPTLTATSTTRVFITPTVSSKAWRRPLGLKVGYASSRAHNNNTSQQRHQSLTPTPPTTRVFITPTVSSKPSRRPFGLKVGFASSRAHNKETNRSGLGFHNSHGVFKSFAQAALIEGGLCEFERTTSTPTLTPTPTTTTIISTTITTPPTSTPTTPTMTFTSLTPTVSSEPSRRGFGLKVGSASSRAHNNNGTNTNINTNYNNNYNNNNIYYWSYH
jgi:hypothetical protein